MAGTHHIPASARMILKNAFLLFTAFLLSSIPAKAEDSGCVDCHTDIDLLAENLAEQTKKKSSLQAGAG